jgi:hypothetical protein
MSHKNPMQAALCQPGMGKPLRFQKVSTPSFKILLVFHCLLNHLPFNVPLWLWGAHGGRQGIWLSLAPELPLILTRYSDGFTLDQVLPDTGGPGWRPRC